MENTDTTQGSNAGIAAKYGIPSTGNPALDAVQDQAVAHALAVVQSGQTINPALNIGPELLSQFLEEAHAQADPYYQQQLTSEIGNINANLNKTKASYEKAFGDASDTFEQNLDATRNTAGGNGVAFSGKRGLDEQYALKAQNRTLSGLTAGATADIGNILRAGGTDIAQGIPGLNGSSNDFMLPSLNSTSATLEGPRGGRVNNGQIDYGFNPSTYQTGTVGSAYGASLYNTRDQYATNYTKKAANAPARTFQNLTNNTAPALS